MLEFQQCFVGVYAVYSFHQLKKLFSTIVLDTKLLNSPEMIQIRRNRKTSDAFEDRQTETGLANDQKQPQVEIQIDIF